MTEYHIVTSCNNCKGENELIAPSYEDGHLHETVTKCIECGFEDYWAYGYFQSGSEMVSNCEKYPTE